MISLKCKNCAGEMSIDLKGELACPYCGSKFHLSDTELTDYKNFRLNVLHFLRAAADSANEQADDSFLWFYHDNVSYNAKDGSRISIDYLFYSEEQHVKNYVAKNSVVFVFDKKERYKVQKMLDGIKMVEYPSADIKNLSKYFPTVKSMIELEDGGMLIAIDKPENAYPLYAFGSVKPEHAAWIVSRLENLCCVFEFSDLVHNGISIDSVFINTRTHEAFLYGGWWNCSRKNSVLKSNADLYALREVAGKIMGEHIEQAPKLFQKFISGKPAPDAYLDFEKWDEVIEKGFGGHKFVKF